jgi:hypothetical protein
MQFDAAACMQKTVAFVTRAGQPQAAFQHLQAQAFAGIDHAGVAGQQKKRLGCLVHVAAP